MVLQRTCEIPEFPFQNRNTEKSGVQEFCSKQQEMSVLLLVADSGVGKSRFLRHVSQHECTNHWESLLISSSNSSDLYFDAIGAISKEITRVISFKNKSEFTTLAQQKLERLYRNFPRFLSSGVKLIPGGSILAEGVDQFAKASLNPNNISARHTAIIELAEITKEVSKRQPLLFLLDDLHNFNFEEIDEVALFLSKLDLSYTKKHIKVIISTQSQSSKNPLYTTWLGNINKSGALATLDFPLLTDQELKKIAAKTIENPKEAAVLIARSAGNPQRLEEQLLKLNSSGALKSKNNLLILPENTSDNIVLSKNLWETISGQGLRKKILGVLAISNSSVSWEDIGFLSKSFGSIEEYEVLEILSELEGERILHWAPSFCGEKNIIEYRYNYMRQQAKSAIINGNVGEKLSFSSSVLSLVQHKLSIHLEFPNTFLKEQSNINAPTASLDEEVFNLLQDYCDVLGIFNKPDYLSCSLGMMRVSFLRKKFDITSSVGGNISLVLNKIFDEDSVEYKYYLEIIAESKYRMGMYHEAIKICEAASCQSPALGYYMGASLLVLKNREGDSRQLVQISEESAKRCCDSGWRSQLDLLHALALQETGQVEEAENYYGESLDRDGIDLTKKQSAVGDIALKMASTLFLNREEAIKKTCEAVDLAEKSSDRRLHGLTLNNLGICKLDCGEIDSARLDFERSELLLQEFAGHESIFPTNNLAGIDLVNREYERARNRLHSCLFRSSSDNYSTTIRLNLALANHKSGHEFNQARFDSYIGKSDIADHTFLQWLIEYARIFILSSSLSGLERNKLLVEFRALLTSKFSGINLAYSYWNRLLEDIGESTDLMVDTTTVISGAGIEFQNSLIRPAFLTFGRI